MVAAIAVVLTPDLETESYSSNLCGVAGEDRTALVWILGIVFGVLGLLSFLLRCIARLHVGAASWGIDDSVMALAVVSETSLALHACLMLTSLDHNDTAMCHLSSS
jgi:hypothetical protein